MDSLVEFFVEEDEYNYMRVINREMRDAENILELPEFEFLKNFRMSKDCFTQILDDIAPKMKASCKATSVPPIIKFAPFLRFLASGSYQKSVGNEHYASMSQPNVSKIVSECLDIFEHYFCAKWIRLEMNVEEENNIKEKFFSKFSIPGVIGCVDGTHIKIKSPGTSLRHLYYNRKGFYSINAMMICDIDMVIRYVDATHPGANHDAHVWKISAANHYLKSGYNAGTRNTWLLGDSGYQLLPYLMTPYRFPAQRHEIAFNEKLCKARNIIERCFGVLKSRFRCISGERVLHYSPACATRIINACCALHNSCIFYRNDWPTQPLQIDSIAEQIATSDPPTNAGATVRNQLAQSMTP